MQFNRIGNAQTFQRINAERSGRIECSFNLGKDVSAIKPRRQRPRLQLRLIPRVNRMLSRSGNHAAQNVVITVNSSLTLQLSIGFGRMRIDRKEDAD